ncbi:MAG TPA: isocitrate/isopropylmalate dehydrogenase family protein [Methanosarcinales archaeon]|nr:isocitrate/isopropylmalate dehydrogenase family protein [Methanosarcinales archaeon]
MMKKAAIIRGDGTGPELVDSMIRVMDAVNTNIEFVSCAAGEEWWKEHGGDSLIPEETWDVLNETDACFKGPTTTPGVVGAPRSVAVSIRQRFDLYANVRPIRTFAGAPAPLGDVNFVAVREATEGMYFGKEIEITDDTFLAIRRITKHASEKISRYAFEEARRRGWDTVVGIHKSNILRMTCGAFMDCLRAIAEEYEDVELWEYHVDNMAQQLVKNPQIFNQKVLVSTNLFMDIISEECAGLIGSIGLVYSANIGDDYAMFEPAHGSAPKYRGLDRVDPCATILAGAWMLRYLGEAGKADEIIRATEQTIAEGTTTYDLGGSASMSQMTDAIVGHLKK